ncbi:MAG: ABC transporter ATP-binding protein [Bacillota bacterium]
MLQVEKIHAYYGMSHVLFDVSLAVGEGEVVCLMGRNGAGKTTTIRSIIGLTPPRQGRIIFRGREITGLATHRAARMGISWVPDNRRIFADLTVAENLEIARKGPAAGRGWDMEKVFALFPVLKDIRGRRGGYLSGGEQQMLSIARGLLGNPDLFLLDEPTEGLAPLIVRELEDQILRLKSEGISILLAEQNIKSALRLADRCYVMDGGRICYHGTVEDLGRDEEIRAMYLLV